MDTEKLKEAIENYKKNADIQDILFHYMESSQFLLDYQTLLSLAQEYLECREGMPKQPYPENIFLPINKKQWQEINRQIKKNLGFPLDRVSGNIGRDVYNAIIHDCTLALMRRCSVEKINKIIEEWGKSIVVDKGLIDDLAQSIHNLIIGKEK